MTNTYALLSPPSSYQRLVSLMIRVFSTVGWLAGLIMLLAGCTNKAANAPTPAPTMTSVSTEQLKNYARAVLAIEPKRQEAYKEIRKSFDGDGKVPEIVCTRTDTIASLDKNVQDIAVNYCNQSKKIAETNSLTIQQFNGITLSAQTDQELQKRIYNELVRLRK
ncbi:MAG: DUF4168 domain-containing protein [Coleofasciculaceae cyanobacterium]